MTDTTADTRARTMRLQGAANAVMRGLLRTPLLCRVVGRRLITVYVVGRKSGRRFSIPVAYTRHDGALLIGTPFAWGRNLRTGEPVWIREKGRRRLADVEVLRTEPEVAAAYAVMCRDNRAFAGFQGIRFDASGNPEPEDLHDAWVGGARAFRLIPR